MITRYAVALAAALFLVACGGGGSSSPVTPPDQPVQDPDPKPPPPDESDPDPDDSDDTTMMPEPEPEPPIVPPVPSGVTVSAGIGVAIVSWDNPFASYDEHGLAHIYRSTSNSFSSATRIGTSRSFLYTDENLQHETTYYYWIVWESESGQRGPVSAPVHDMTALNPSDFPDVRLPPADDDDDTATEPDTDQDSRGVTMQTTGSFSVSSRMVDQVEVINGVPTSMSVTEQWQTLENWGYWAQKDGETLFIASIDARRIVTDGVARMAYYIPNMLGERTRTNPVSGPVVWTGGVRGITEDFTRVTGTSRLEADLGAATIDVDFTGFDDGRANMSWDGLSMTDGAFRGGLTLNGAFVGENHEGVVGAFNRDGLRGVFGATR